MKDIKNKISIRSLYGIKSLTRIFKAMDTKGDCNIDVDDFRWGLMDFGVQITKEEAQELLNSYSTDASNVNYGLFMDQFKVSTYFNEYI